MDFESICYTQSSHLADVEKLLNLTQFKVQQKCSKDNVLPMIYSVAWVNFYTYYKQLYILFIII